MEISPISERRTSVDQLIPGMVLAEPIFHPMSLQMIWNTGTTLTDRHIALLRKMNPDGVCVMDFVPRGPQSGAIETPGLAPPTSAIPPRPEAATGLNALRFTPPVQRATSPSLAATPAPQSKPALERRPPTLTKATATIAPAATTKPRPSWERLPEPLRQPQRVREEVLGRNFTMVRHMTESVRHSSRIDFNQVDGAVQNTIRQIVGQRELIENLIDLRVYDEYTYAHSANVMSLALVVGSALNYPPERLRVLGIGAILHDLGKTLVPEEILNKPSRLTEEEFRIMASHPANGIMILSNYNWATSEIKNCAFQHHEKYNGMGYPMALRSSQITELAQIVSIVDFYDALISDRCYKKGLAPNVVYQAIVNAVNVYFEARIVQAFLRFIVPYPVNAQVLLSNGQAARVLKVNRKNLLAPLVLVEGAGEIDLSRQTELTIETISKLPTQHPTLFAPR